LLAGTSLQNKLSVVFDLPIKCVKAEHVVRCIPLGLLMRGLGCSNFMLCIYAISHGECYYCALGVVSALFVKRYLCTVLRKVKKVKLSLCLTN
jgi:hypothetical protein